MAPTDVSFTSDGITMAGHLRLPDRGRRPARPGPAVVLTGPLSGVKEQVTGAYAERLTAAGYVTLCFDHRNFGASGGAPRQHEDAAGKLHDLRDAVSFLAARPEVDSGRIGCCGICLGGGYALRFAAFDPRIRAVAGIAGGYNSPAGDARAAWVRTATARSSPASRRSRSGRPRPARSSTGPPSTPTTATAARWSWRGEEPREYYGTARSASPGWVNQLTALSVLELITARPGHRRRFRVADAAADRARPDRRVHRPRAGPGRLRSRGRAEGPALAGHQQPHRPLRCPGLRGPGRGRHRRLVRPPPERPGSGLSRGQRRT